MSSLDNSDFEHIIKLYTNFKEEISINRKPNNKECYLIKGTWDTDLNENFKNYNSNGTRPKTKYKDGRYFGQFRNDKREGKGIYYYNNGDRYEGDWRNGKREGQGIYYYNNGYREMGDYYNDNPIGKHVILTRNGEVEINNY